MAKPYADRESRAEALRLVGAPPYRVPADRDTQIPAGDGDGVVVDPRDLADKLDFLPTAYIGRSVHDRVRLMITRDQHAHSVLGDALPYCRGDHDFVADFDRALRHANDSGAATGFVKRLLMEHRPECQVD